MMTLESILADATGLAAVTGVLVSLSLVARLFLFVRSKNSAKETGEAEDGGRPGEDAAPAEPAAQPTPAAPCMQGELKLNGVDERTAALIMAIVSHESGIPLSELNFKSIRLTGSNPSEDRPV